MNGQRRDGLDEELEGRLRDAFSRAPEPPLPPTIPAAVIRMRSGEASMRLGRQAVMTPLRTLAGIAVTFIVAASPIVALAHSFGVASPSSGPMSPLKSPGPVSSEAWSGPFVPVAMAAPGAARLILVGGTGDGVGDAVVATSDDGGHVWTMQHLNVPALGWVTAAGSTVWATTVCPTDAPLGCEEGLIVSSDGGSSWRLTSERGRWHPWLVDERQAWALSPPDLRNPASLAVTTDGGATWSVTTACLRQTAWAGWTVEFASPTTAWLACIGDSGSGTQAKELVGTTDGWQTDTLLAAAGFSGTDVGSIPLRGQLGGISMRPGGSGWLWTSGTDGALYRTADGGRTWNALSLPRPGAVPVAVAAAVLLSDRAGYVLMRSGSLTRLLSTDDGGQAWTEPTTWSAPPPSASPSLTLPSATWLADAHGCGLYLGRYDRPPDEGTGGRRHVVPGHQRYPDRHVGAG